MNWRLKKMQCQSEETKLQVEQMIQSYGKPYETLDRQLEQVENEYGRVYDISINAHQVIEDIDKAFMEKTKLSQTDVALLFLCTALQCVRQYILTNDRFRFTDTKNDMGQTVVSSSQKGDRFMHSVFGTKNNANLFDSVPYDAISLAPDLGELGLGGTTHRYRTLGHDPVLGWIFGTANIMTSSLTKHDFSTYIVHDMRIMGPYPLGVAGMLGNAVTMASQDFSCLSTALLRQAIHFGSDMFTTQGLPVPFIMTVNNDLAKQMVSKWHIDTWSVLRGSTLASFINQLIFCIHQLFYTEEYDGTMSMYQVRTRKILSYSNALATGSNVIVVALTRDMTKLDFGGMLVTIHRLISDNAFIQEVKRDFLKNEIYNQVVGTPYDFMEGRYDV